MPTALIVEDEPEANKLLAKLVELRGYRTQSAFLGGEAMVHARDLAPDVVFLDLMLPDLDGYEVCRNLKSSGITRGIPVVIVTARVAAENRIESFSAGADDYVPKPYTPDQIFRALDRSKSSKQQLEAPELNGTVVLDYRERGDTLRNLARLRNFMLARYGPEAAMPIAVAIKTIWSSVDTWTRRFASDEVATLSYALTRDCLTMIVKESGGFLPSLHQDPEGQIARCLTDGQFDRIVTRDDANSLTLVKHFKSLDEPGS